MTQKPFLLLLFIVCSSLALTTCKKDRTEDTPYPITVEPEPEVLNTIPEFYKPAEEGEYGKTAPTFELVASRPDGLETPQDLDFNPTNTSQLWIINKGSEHTGGNTVMITNPGTAGQQFDKRTDGNAWHFMSLPTALAFSNNSNWATTSGIKDANHAGGTYAGPALWSSDLNIYARPSGGNGSHLDMLHGSPYSMGIAADHDNAFWVFDGYHEHLCWYDFVEDHGPGGDDHSDGRIHRFTGVVLKRHAEVPSHLAFDQESRWLYICNTGERNLIAVNTATQSKTGDLPLINEPLAEHWSMDVEFTTHPLPDITTPCGLELVDNRLFVSDYATGTIVVFDREDMTELARIETGKPGIMGLKVGPDGNLWFVNAQTGELFRVIPS